MYKRNPDAAYTGMTEAQMMACFGRLDERMPAPYIAKVSCAKLGVSGQGRMIALDQTRSIGEFGHLGHENARATIPSSRQKSLAISMPNVGFWCARRAHAFVVISRACSNAPSNKVLIMPKSAFPRAPTRTAGCLSKLSDVKPH